VTSLPLQHFRRSVAQFAATPEAHAMIFASTSVTREMLASPDFALTPEILWCMCDNLTAKLGRGWYCRLPALWAIDVQSDFESAMRFAPTLRDAMDTVERFGSLRWPIVRWKNVLERDVLRTVNYRNAVISAANWQMLGVLFTLNFETIMEAAFPATIGRIVHDISGDPPLPASELDPLFRNRVRWNAKVHSALIPRNLLDLPSALADSRAFSAATALLETLPLSTFGGWRTRAANALGDAHGRRLRGEDVSTALGISLRSLERHLAEEGTSFRELRDESLKARLEALLRGTDLSLAAIAERLGYSDESALSRATRRWHGCSAAEARKRVRSGAGNT
jgi:AraC-like DNA-binding protein